MKKRMKRGSMTIEAALLMPLLLLVVTITLYLFFYVHNKVWLTAAAYEAALDGSMETARPEGKSRDKALKKGKELGNTGFCGEYIGKDHRSRTRGYACGYTAGNFRSAKEKKCR